MLDGMLKKIGMTGRSLFSLLMGFGCTATALVTTRNMDNIKLKQRTALILPFMSCSAKLPILLVFASAFFIKNKVFSSKPQISTKQRILHGSFNFNTCISKSSQSGVRQKA